MKMSGSESPYIKKEIDDGFYNRPLMMSEQRPHNHYAIAQQRQAQFGQNPQNQGGINPNDLSMPMGPHVGSYMGQSSFQNNFIPGGSSTHNSFNRGISAIDDDELIDSLPYGDANQAQHSHVFSANLDDFDFSVPTQRQSAFNNGMPNATVADFSLYSSTPDGEPMQSPFTHGFNTQQMQHLQSQQRIGGSFASPSSFGGSPLHTPNGFVGSMSAPRSRPSVGLQRKGSSTRSPMGKHAVMNGMDFSQPIATTSARHQKTSSGNYEQNFGSLSSFGASPANFGASPTGTTHPNAQISDFLKSGTGSMPTKLGTTTIATQEAKRRRRRESHNLVERRRRDNINERISELSKLVPQHRLDDDKVRKAIANNSPLSPILGTVSMGISPPGATSTLAGVGAKRASAGNITTGLPADDKDKGPNKGDILNGSVSWTRDLMWMLHMKLQQEAHLREVLGELGQPWPFEQTEDEKRMTSELMATLSRNDAGSFEYSRRQGEGLYVPGHTDVKGNVADATVARVQPRPNNGQGDSTSPETGTFQAQDEFIAGLGSQDQYWEAGGSNGTPGSVSFKEEDEYMDHL